MMYAAKLLIWTFLSGFVLSLHAAEPKLIVAILVDQREQLLDGRATGPLGTLAVNGYNAERGGDLVLIPKPYFIPGGGKTGATHGSAYAYDTHVPILLYGSVFKQGRYPAEFNITDIVPTLCAALGMNEPAGCMGKPRWEVLHQTSAGD
jgi:hypothetical protein